eukprot:3603204-Prymnesium_polylepis.2
MHGDRTAVLQHRLAIEEHATAHRVEEPRDAPLATQPFGAEMHHLEACAPRDRPLGDEWPVHKEAQRTHPHLGSRIAHENRAIVDRLAVGPRLECANAQARVLDKEVGHRVEGLAVQVACVCAAQQRACVCG